MCECSRVSVRGRAGAPARARGRVISLGVALVAALPLTGQAASTLSSGCLGAAPAPTPSTPSPASPRFGVSLTASPQQYVAIPDTAPPPRDAAAEATALTQLSGGHPLVVRLTGFQWINSTSPDTNTLAAIQSTVTSETRAGHLVAVELDYRPPGQSGNPIAFADWVRKVVSALDANPSVVALEVTHEANSALSPSRSDGASAGAPAALIQGLISARVQESADATAAAASLPYGPALGFTWLFTGDGPQDGQFFCYLGINGGSDAPAGSTQGAPTLAQSVDWVGVDLEPPLAGPSASAGTDPGAVLLQALGQLRGAYRPCAGLGSAAAWVSQAAFSSESPAATAAYSDSPAHGEADEAAALRAMVGAVRTYGGAYGVTDFSWYDLRDGDSTSADPQQHQGLMRSDYTSKAAFGVYSCLIAGTC
jgi:hypothetical protein